MDGSRISPSFHLTLLFFFFFPILSFYLVEQTGRGSGELIIFPLGFWFPDVD
jgi:hypothetical protein